MLSPINRLIGYASLGFVWVAEKCIVGPPARALTAVPAFSVIAAHDQGGGSSD
jgi:hypothetical protein